VAVALLHASGGSMGFVPGPSLTAVVGLGTMAVYGFDRWAVHRRERPIWALPALGATVLGLGLPMPAITILGAVCALALVHARLRELPWAKPLYISAAWLGVVVGVPWVLGDRASPPGVALPIALAIVANVLACDAVDREAEAARLGPERVWWTARAVALAGVLVGWPGPGTWIPAALFVSLSRRPRSRDQAELLLDGALLVGALVALGVEG
jgi:hypothetical protein